MPNIVNAGEETTITMDYVNKGKGDVSNVEASVEGDGITATQAKQYVGNVASGASGSIGFAFTADKPGETEAKLTVTYENSDGQPQTKEFPVKSMPLKLLFRMIPIRMLTSRIRACRSGCG